MRRPWPFSATPPPLNPHEEALAHAYDGELAEGAILGKWGRSKHTCPPPQ